MKKLFYIVMLIAVSVGVNAGPVTTAAGESYLFSFSFDPAPSTILDGTFFTDIDYATLDGGDAGNWTFYNDVDATGVSGDLGPLDFLSLSGGSVDGSFSVLLEMISGSVVLSPSAQLLLSNQEVVTVLPRSAVPAPATLALFGLGLAGLGWKRRKQA